VGAQAAAKALKADRNLAFGQVILDRRQRAIVITIITLHLLPSVVEKTCNPPCDLSELVRMYSDDDMTAYYDRGCLFGHQRVTEASSR